MAGSFPVRIPDGIRDLMEDVFSGFAGYGLRTAGLALIFALGSGGLVAALGISATASQQVQDRLTAAALDEVTARPTAAADTSTDQPSGLPRNAPIRACAVDGVLACGMIWTVPGSAGRLIRTANDPIDGSQLSVLGITPDVLDVYRAQVYPTSSRALLDQKATPNTAILGPAAATAFGITSPATGVRIRIGHIPLEVVGLITDHGEAPGLDNAILLPQQTVERLSGQLDQSLVVRTTPGRAFVVSQVLAAAIAPSEPASVSIDPVADLRSLRRGVNTDLSSSAALLAAVMLALASVSTANVMTMNVTDRIPEIALRRAVGTRRSRVALTFLLEGAAIGLLGGAVGAAAGVVTVLAAAWDNSWTPVLPPWLAPTGVAAGLAIGMLAATRAAYRAGQIQPALALRQ